MGNADARPQIPLKLRPILPPAPEHGGIEMEELFPKVFLASQQQVHSSRCRAAAAPGAQIIKILPSIPSIHLLEVVSLLSLKAGSYSDCVPASVGTAPSDWKLLILRKHLSNCFPIWDPSSCESGSLHWVQGEMKASNTL